MKTKNFLRTLDGIKEKNSLDLSAWEDLSVALMNLVSLEEHCFFSYVKTKDEKFLKMLEKVRELRKKLLALIVKDEDESEKWCMSKHFLASSMRLFEVGNRLLHEKKEKEAKELYENAAELYGMFWLVNSAQKDFKDIKINIEKKEEKSIFSSIKELLKCCKE